MIFQTFQHTGYYTWRILISRWHSYVASDLMKDCKDLSRLRACKCCCFEKLLAAEWLNGVKWCKLTCCCGSYGSCRCEKSLVAFFFFLYKLFQACLFTESYHGLYIVEYFFKTTANAQHVLVFISYFLFI